MLEVVFSAAAEGSRLGRYAPPAWVFSAAAAAEARAPPASSDRDPEVKPRA